MPTRAATADRKTTETQIALSVDVDGSGRATLATGIPFLDHMLDQVARHAMLDLDIRAKGDLQIDAHHTVEDIGITLGQAVARAVGDKKGIDRKSTRLNSSHTAISYAVFYLHEKMLL